MDIAKFAAALDAQADSLEQSARAALTRAEDMADNIAVYVTAAKVDILRSVAAAARAAE
ncbi:MAG TPA: hypothetical protein VK558_07770 [Patescibacteria group bacterium]|nr:hypothetical protein [Patescibacteria group bacterium]